MVNRTTGTGLLTEGKVTDDAASTSTTNPISARAAQIKADTALASAKAYADNALAPAAVNTRPGSYTLVAADAKRPVRITAPSAVTLTFPPDVFAAGDVIDCGQWGAGLVTIAPGAGVTPHNLDGVYVSAGQWAVWSIEVVGPREFNVYGQLGTAASTTPTTPTTPTTSTTSATFPTNGAGAPTGWSMLVSQGAVDVAQNALQLTAAASAYGGGPAVLWTGMTPTADGTITCKTIFPAQVEQYPVLGVRADTSSGVSSYPLNGLCIELQPGPIQQHWLAVQVVNGAKTQLGSGDLTFPGVGVALNHKFFLSGGIWRWRMWTGATEPTTWNLDLTGVSPTAAGKFWAAQQAGNSTTPAVMLVDDVLVA